MAGVPRCSWAPEIDQLDRDDPADAILRGVQARLNAALVLVTNSEMTPWSFPVLGEIKSRSLIAMRTV